MSIVFVNILSFFLFLFQESSELSLLKNRRLLCVYSRHRRQLRNKWTINNRGGKFCLFFLFWNSLIENVFLIKW